MKVYTAVEDVPYKEGDIWCFLAGGITNCWNWQDAVIRELEKKEYTERLVILNPRRKDFPIDDPNAAQEQIEWEFKYLNSSDIFSMYFASGESTQPICMYELGRHLARLASDPEGPQFAVISTEKGYVREQDVRIQSNLVLNNCTIDHDELVIDMNSSPAKHADAIYQAYRSIYYPDGGEIL